MDVYKRNEPWTSAHDCRLKRLNDKDPSAGGSYVLYWMVATRRLNWNNALDRAIHWANKLDKPLLVLEGLSFDYPWASERHHQFIIDGMTDNRLQANNEGLNYRCFVSHPEDTGAKMLGEVSKNAAVIITDHFPCFFIPAMLERVAARVSVKMEAVDSNGFIPLSWSEKAHTTAYSFRRFVQKHMIPALNTLATENPGTLLQSKAPIEGLDNIIHEPNNKPDGSLDVSLSELPIDHDVRAGSLKGGTLAGNDRAGRFVALSLEHYNENRNNVDPGGTSLLSPYLHYGHVSSQQVVSNILADSGWSPDFAPEKAHGSRTGWWNLGAGTEAFLDQIITWRELGFHFCHHHTSAYDTFESLPHWAQVSLNKHKEDPRPTTYTLEQLENSLTHDALWNAAQRELVSTGLMHNYLRMLWGKKILEWSPSPEEAIEILIHLNNKYALDGRDPNSYSGIMWTFGRFDRAWGPERPIYGKVRYMTSASTLRKLKLKDYVARYG